MKSKKRSDLGSSKPIVGMVMTRFERSTWELAANECMALVISSSGYATISELEVSQAGVGVLAKTPDSNDPAEHIQLCASDAPLTAHAHWFVIDKPAVIDWVALKAPSAKIGGNTALTRGIVPIDPEKKP